MNLLTVGGNLLVESDGLLRMTDPDGVVDLTGSATFTGAGTAGSLSAGRFEIDDNFTSRAVCCWQYDTFVASDLHRVVFDGSSIRNVSLGNSGLRPENAHFQDFEVGPDARVHITSRVVALGDVDVFGTLVTNAGQTLDIYGLLSLALGSTVDNGGRIIYSTLVDNGATLLGNPLTPR
jgi:hypothetical protein